MQLVLAASSTVYTAIYQNNALKNKFCKSPINRSRVATAFSDCVHFNKRIILQSRWITSASSGDSPSFPNTARDCVNAGLESFESGDAVAALKLFQYAMKLNPNDDEARAALYNSACALTKLRRWEEASNAVISAVNDHGLKLSVALRDPDLALLRQRREWNLALSQAVGGISNNSYVKLRAEAKAPFRLTRIFLFGALSAGAGAGLIIIVSRLIAAMHGGDGAPELEESIQNFAINLGALALFVYLLNRDLAGQSKDQNIVEREETLAQLQIEISPGRTVPLAAFRGSTRPVIITGSKGQITKALAAAQPFKSELRLRGVSVVPVVLSEGDEDPGEKLRRLKAELQGNGDTDDVTRDKAQLTAERKTNNNYYNGKSKSVTKGFAATSSSATFETTDQAQAQPNADRRWQLEAAGVEEWRSWVSEQAVSAGVTSSGDNYYVQVQLDGSVRASGAGSPPWRQFLDDIPPLDDVRTKLTDGRGMGMDA